MPGLASILQRLAMTDPLSVRTPPFMPSRVPIGLGGSVAAEDLGGIGVDPTGLPPDVPMEPSPRQGPGVRQRLMGAVPGILRGAAIGLSMPSTGSSTMDAARAFVASGDDRDAQTIRQFQLNRQRAQDERQSILDSMRMEEHRADMDMLPIRRRMLESQAAENDAQAARNAAQANARPDDSIRAKIATLREMRPNITDRELGTALGLWGPQYDDRRSFSFNNLEGALSAGAMDAEDPATREAFLRRAEQARTLGRAPARPIINQRTGQQYIPDESGRVTAVNVPGAAVPQAAAGRSGGGGRQMTPGQTRKAEVEDAANQAVKEADAWIKQNKRTDLNVFDLAISNLDKFFAKDPRVVRAKPEIVAQIRKLQAEMTNTGPQRRRTDEDDANLNSTYGNTQAVQPSARPASSTSENDGGVNPFDPSRPKPSRR